MDNYNVETIDRTARSQRVVTTDKPFKQSVLLPNIRSKKKMFTTLLVQKSVDCIIS